jgi:radical SAM superfamily enzyme YgiQ (UPF0313 family)
MMKVTLVSPPFSNKFPSFSYYPPLGLASLSAVLEKNKIEVSLIDAAAEDISIENTVKKILDTSPDLIGITTMTLFHSQIIKMAKMIKKQTNTPICLGGQHATFLADQLLSTGDFDFVVRGEGELTLTDLCNSLQTPKKMKSIKGLSFVKNGKTFHNPVREFISDLDTLPRAAYHLLPFQDYQPKAPPGFIRKKPWITIITSRGCPFGCRFCSSSVYWGKIWRGQSVERVSNDLEWLVSKYELKSLLFVDDNFTFYKKRIEQICSEIVKRRLNFEFSCSCRVDQVDFDLLSKMHDAGCWRIGFGIEAGTQEALDWYGKKITLEKSREAIKLCKRVGISPICYFIIGAPFETEEMILKTVEFAKELDVEVVGFSFLVPFPGSQLYEYSIKNNLLLEHDLEKFGQDIPIIKMQNLTPEKLSELSRMAYRSYYFRPKFILKNSLKMFRHPAIALKGFKTVMNWMKKENEDERNKDVGR